MKLNHAAALAALVLLTPLTASAARPATATLALNPAVGSPTTETKAKGAGFEAREVIALYFDGDRIGSDTAGPTGKFITRLTVPASAVPGNHALEAVGQSSGVSARANFLVRTDWLQACFESGRSCFNPYENVLGHGNVGALTVAWRAHLTVTGPSPVYANGLLFFATAHGLRGVDPATGAIIINYRAAPVTTTPAVIRGFDPQPDPPGKVIFGTADGILHAASTTGEPLWQVSLGAVPASPLVSQRFRDTGGNVVVGAGNTLFAFDGDGNRLWATVLEGGDVSKAPVLLQAAEAGEKVIAAAGDTLHALDPATGAVLWSTAPSRSQLGAPSIGNPDIIGDPSIIGDPHILVGDEAGNLFSIEPGTGAIVASFAARGPITASPAIGDPNLSDPWVFTGDGGGNIYAADTTNEFPPPSWQAALGGPIHASPVLANGVLYVGTDPEIGDPHIFALDAGSGRVLFDDVLPGGMLSSAIVADGKLVVTTKTSEVVVYEGPDT